MKFTLSSLALVAAASAQSVQIGSPTQGQVLTRGAAISVRVQRPSFLSSVAEIGVGITMRHCFETPCDGSSDGLGPVLFAGAFTPQRDPTMPAQPPFQDYPITVPDLGPGNAVVFVSHASMVGANSGFFTEIVNQTVVLV